MTVTFDITPEGGHLADVKFRLGRSVVEPFSTASWCGKPEASTLIPLLKDLRGDFFCAPFGDGPAWRGEVHPAHGESANGKWKVMSRSVDEIRATLATRIRKGFITKTIICREGETNLYQTHELEGFSGPMCLGHHAMLDFRRNGPGQLTTSRLRLGQVLPVRFEDPVQGGYSSLKTGAWFKHLDNVSTANGDKADLSSYPAREGFEDLVMVHHKDAEDFAWNAVVFPEKGFVWFALKNPNHLASTVLWHSNGGRHYAPWSGRHRGVLGVEDVTAYFHLGLAASAAKNPWSEKGIPTTLKLQKNRPLRIPYIMGVAAIPDGFDTVKTLSKTQGGIRLESPSGLEIRHAVDTGFL